MTQYVWTGTKNLFSLKHARWGWYKKTPSPQYVKWSLHDESLFAENAKKAFDKKAPLNQFVEGHWHKKAFLTEKEILFFICLLSTN